MSDALTAPSGFKVMKAVSAYQSARDRLLSADTDLEHDEAALIELLGPETQDIDEILNRLVSASVHACAMADLAANQMTALAARRDRYKRRNEMLRAMAMEVLNVTGQRRFETPAFTVSIRGGIQSAVIQDIDTLPEVFVRLVTERKPERSAILAALKAGQDVPGATLSNGSPSIQVRTT